MTRNKRALQGLRWRLALSYILVTVVVAVTVHLVDGRIAAEGEQPQ
jgi:amino acid permease